MFVVLKNVRAYVLVGSSTRFPGKHFADIFHGKRLIDFVVENLVSIGLDVFIYSKIPFKADVPVIEDNSKWIMNSIISLFERDDEFFLFGGDMPLVKKEAVEYLIDKYSGKTLVPRWSGTGYLEPLHAIYSRTSLECLENARSLTKGLSNCKWVEFMDAELLPEHTFFNVNTRDDLHRLRKLLGIISI